MSAYFLVSHQPGVTRIARARLRFRRWFHIIPLKGPSAVQRRRVRKAKGDAQYLRENSYHRGTWYLDGPVKIKKLRRVVTEGTYGRLWASERPCCEKECSACSGRGADGHAHRNCETSEFTRCRQIQVTPAAGSPPTSRGDLAREGDLLGDGARDGDVLAAETNSNETHFVLVKAVGNGATEVPNNYTCPFEEANFSYPRTKKAIWARVMRPVTLSRGDASVTRYEEHSSADAILVPCPNLRSGRWRCAASTCLGVRILLALPPPLPAQHRHALQLMSFRGARENPGALLRLLG